jgi:hypothetical protein
MLMILSKYYVKMCELIIVCLLKKNVIKYSGYEFLVELNT